jgi:hypothetical protein
MTQQQYIAATVSLYFVALFCNGAMQQTYSIAVVIGRGGVATIIQNYSGGSLKLLEDRAL